MLFSVPLFTVTTYITEPTSFDYGLSLIHSLDPTTAGGQIAFQDTIILQQNLPDTPLIMLYVNQTQSNRENLILEWFNEDVNLTLLRNNEKEIAQLEMTDNVYLAVYDMRQIVQL